MPESYHAHASNKVQIWIINRIIAVMCSFVILSLLQSGQNALHKAAWGGHVNTIRYLAPKMELLLHSTGHHEYTMIHCAAHGGHAEAVQILIDEFDLDPNARDVVSV